MRCLEEGISSRARQRKLEWNYKSLGSPSQRNSDLKKICEHIKEGRRTLYSNLAQNALNGEMVAMRKIRDVSEDEMIAIFLKAEINSTRFCDKLKLHIQQEKIDSQIVQEPDWHNASENAIRRKLLGVYRGYGENRDYFPGFPIDVRWELTRISKEELERVRYINWEYWLDLTDGTRMAVDGARNALEGKVVYDVSPNWLVSLTNALRQGTIFPPLILVATDLDAPLVVMEGHARLTAYLASPECIPHDLEVIIGYSEQMTAWDCY